MQWFFDGIIFGYLIISLPLLYWLASSRMGKRVPSGLAGTLIFLLVMGWITLFYGSFVEPRMIVEREVTISLSDQPQQSQTFAVMSDLHVGPYKGEHYIERLVQHIEKRDPDGVFLLGDYVYKKAEDLPKLAPLYFLTEHYPVYAIMGNHDYDLVADQVIPDEDLAQKTRAVMQSLGVHLLENQGLPLANDSLYLAGFQELWTHQVDIPQALSGHTTDTPVIALAHNPDTVSTYSDGQQIDLTLSGHTHGGQIRLPLIGPVGKIPTMLGQSIDKGIFEINGHKVFVTSGTGESGPRARLFNPPEIVFLTIEY